MPTIPRATPQVGIPQQIGAPNYGVVSSVTNRQLSNLDRALQKNQASIMQTWRTIDRERDVAQAHDAIYNFNEAARSKYSELRSLRGGDAIDLGKKYDEWYQNASMEIASNLSNTNQQNIFKNAAESRRGRDLESLSGYEIGEHQSYMQSVFDSGVSGAKKDAALYSNDPTRIDGLIKDMNVWADAAYPGKDNSILKQAVADDMHSIAILAQSERNPQQAKKMLEMWRPSLGAKAIDLSKEVDKEFLYFEATTRFKGDYNKQYDWVKGIKNVDEDTKRRVLGRINSDEAEAYERERRILGEHDKAVKANNLSAWVMFNNGQMTSDKLDGLARSNSIDTATYKGIFDRMNGSGVQDNPIVVGDIAEKIVLGEDASKDLENAVNRGQISTSTYISMRTNFAKKGFTASLNYLTEAMKPPQFYYNPDKALKYAEALKSFNNRVAAGEDPATVANEIVKNNTAEIRRTSVGLALPTYLKGGKQSALDIDSLNDARIETALAFGKGELTESEYRFQMELIDKRLALAAEQEQSASVDNAELNQRLKEANKLNN